MIDTRQKRFSMLGWGMPWVPTLPVPDGGFNQADQQELLFSYSGILWLAPAIPVLPLYAAVLNDNVGYGANLRA